MVQISIHGEYDHRMNMKQSSSQMSQTDPDSNRNRRQDSCALDKIPQFSENYDLNSL